MLYEVENEDMDTYAVELNSYVDTVLNKVYDMGQDRRMIFSSFNPDICLLLSFKQPSIPVLFLTDSGASPAGDIRAGSLQEGIRFASRWNLLGVVSQAEPLVLCPRLVRVVKESGLVCVTYGVLNNNPANVKVSASQSCDCRLLSNIYFSSKLPKVSTPSSWILSSAFGRVSRSMRTVKHRSPHRSPARTRSPRLVASRRRPRSLFLPLRRSTIYLIFTTS